MRQGTMMMRRCLFLLLSLCFAGGCTDSFEEPLKTREQPFDAAKVQAPRVHSENKQLAFRFMDRETGELTMVTKVEEVPEEVKNAVIVLDLDPQKVHHPRALFVTDLSAIKSDGSYGTQVLDRFEFEAIQESTKKEEQAQRPAGKTPVVMFSAQWCGACKQAAKWLRAQQIPFTERDVEKDPKALGDLKNAARKAGMTAQSIGGSVPVFVVGGKIFKGFNPSAIEAAYKQQK